MESRGSDNTPRALIAARWRIATLVPRGGAGPVTALVLVNLLLGVLPVAFVLATGSVLGRVPAAVRDGLGSAAWDSLVQVFVVAALVFAAQQVLAPLATALAVPLARRVDGLVFDRLMATALGTPGVAPLEDQQALDALRVAVGGLEFSYQSPGQACAGLLALIARYTQLAGYVIVVGVAGSWTAAAVLLVAVLLFRYGQRGGLRKYGSVRIANTPAERKADYLRQLAMRPAAGKELRVFGLTEWLTGRYRDSYLAWLRPLWAARRRVYLWPFVGYALWGLAASVFIFVTIGRAAADGDLSLAAFVVVVQATLTALRLGEFYPEADVQTAIGMLGYDGVQRFADRVRAVTAGSGPEPAPTTTEVPEPVDGLHFDGVTFRYPGTDRAVFDGLELRLPAGKCTAVVGVNGAGKTTLVKLLTRLYEPDQGAVRLDGTDIRDFPLERWRARNAVIFQQFARFEVSAADNIAYGAVQERDDRDGIAAAARAAGIAEALRGLPRGLDTPLARHLTGGADLSGGQWQRIALARVLFALRHGAGILVLDEPTAALDIRAEARFFDEFAELTRGATTLLISHRFSTVRHADQIVVLDQGRVAEQGNHDELLARGGRYAELFRLQADRFTDEADPAEAMA
jgi:ATP-binding cassette subfamily B protein